MEGLTNGNIMLLLHTLTTLGSHVASLIKFPWWLGDSVMEKSHVKFLTIQKLYVF